MLPSIQHLINNNKEWVQEKLATNPDYFTTLSQGQQPKYLWIGCSDSRVPPNEITKTVPGEIFVHRNIANLVIQTDMNLLSVIQYAVDVLKVEHIIVCGHYKCGGVHAAMHNQQFGLIDNWLQQIKDTYNFYWNFLKDLDEEKREERLVELSVVQQVYNLGKVNTIQNAWRTEGRPYLHGWVYDLKSGLVKAQTPMINGNEGIDQICRFANSQIAFNQGYLEQEPTYEEMPPIPSPS
jgi:carbonic anhydrase